MKTVIANSIEYIIPDHLHPHSDPNPQLNRIVPIFNHTPKRTSEFIEHKKYEVT